MDSVTRIGRVGRVIVPVSDQEKALDFYVNVLGFEKRVDAESPAGRWIEVAPPGAATAIALVGPQHDGARFGLATDDADALHAQLQARGVDVGAEVLRVGNGVPPMFAFRDPEGNAIRVSEQSAPAV